MLMGQSVSAETASERIGDGYMKSYAEIPTARINDSYLAAKKLGGHLRLFDPQNLTGQHSWLVENRTVLEIAYGEEAVGALIDRIAAAMLGQERG